MKPFLLLSSRASDTATRGEGEAVRRLAGLDERTLVQLRLERQPLPELQLDDYSGILLGGSDFCVSSPDKSETQLRVEAELSGLLERVVAADFPFFGLCYGVGVLATFLGGSVGHANGEAIGAIEVTLTDAGRADPLLDGVPDRFHAFVGHKEGADALPPGATLLGAGVDCPVQLFRVGRRGYAAQFHPELDADGLVARMRVYINDGYFDPAQFDTIATAAHAAGVDGSVHRLLANFARLFAKP